MSHDKWWIAFLGLLAASLVLLAGCWNQREPEQRSLNDVAAAVSDSNQATQAAAAKAAVAIDDATLKVGGVTDVLSSQSSAMAGTPMVAKIVSSQVDVLKLDVTPKLRIAGEAVSTIKTQTAVVVGIVPELQAASVAMDRLKAERDTAQADLAKANEKSRSSIKAIFVVLVVIGVATVALGGYLIFMGQLKIGLSLIGGGLLLIGLTTLVDRYFDYIMYGAAAMLVIAGAGLVYLLWQSRKAFFETGNLVEALKQQMTPEELAKIFGDGAIPGLVQQLVGESQTALYKLGVKLGFIKVAT
ncbi:MAG: hypothetical protein IMZ57_04080 [Acidobacteria bacterium]|nr:hypothetical protein [Acidobacteriota bacterium]